MVKLHLSAQFGPVSLTAGHAAIAIWEASHKIRCGCLECVHLARTRRCYLTSFWVAWARRMWADHCLQLVLVSSSANCCRLLVQQSSLPACGACGLCSLISNRGDLLLNASNMPLRWRSTENDHDASSFLPSGCRVSRTSVRRHALSPSRACQQRLLRRVLVPPKSTCTTVRVSECSSQERSLGDRWMSLLSNWLPTHWKSRELSFFILGHHMWQFCCWAFQVLHTERCAV